MNVTRQLKESLAHTKLSAHVLKMSSPMCKTLLFWPV